MISGHGDDIYSQSTKVVCNFSSNVDTLQDLSALRTHLTTCISQIHSYPEPDAASFAELLAKKHRVDSSHFCITNGATEAIYLIAQAFRGAKSAIIIPTFSEYEDASTLNQHQLSFYLELDEVPQSIELVWLCNPNNPTGKVYSKIEIMKFLASHPHTTLIIDQSYEQFCPEELFTVDEAIQHERLILLHSLTKHFAIPGLRLGYFSSSTSLVNKIAKYRMPWSVNQLAIEAGKFLETEYDNLVDLTRHLANAAELYEELSNIEQLEVNPSVTQFFLCQIKENTRTAKELKEYLMNTEGFLIRDASNFRGLTPQHFRIASQLPEQNQKLVKAIKSWF